MRWFIVLQILFASATYAAFVTAGAVLVGALDFEDPLLHALAHTTARVTSSLLNSFT
jgi:H+/gluconate symporter-like permease